MNEREAIEIIEGGLQNWDSILDVLAVAVKALKKRIPKEAEIHEDECFIKCPSCGGNIGYLADPAVHKFCLKCGQRLEVKRNAEQEN